MIFFIYILVGDIKKLHQASFFKHRESLKKERMIRLEQRQQQARGLKVKLYRSYRTGELPDIEIAPRDILQPLEVTSL